MNGLIIFLTVAFASISYTNARKVPSYIPKCKANDPELEKCILDGVEAVRPHLANGIREINIPPVEPFAIEKLQVDRNTQNLKMKLILTNMKAYGCSGFVINKFKLLRNENGAEGTITFPTLNVTSDFDINGNLFNQKLKGKGIFSANLKNVKVDLNAKIKNENGKYVQMKDMKFRIVKTGDTSDVKLLPSNDATGKDNSKNLKDALRFFNSNREQVFELAIPIVEETGREIILNIGNNVLKSNSNQ